MGSVLKKEYISIIIERHASLKLFVTDNIEFMKGELIMSDVGVSRRHTKQILTKIRNGDYVDCEQVIPNTGMTISEFTFEYVRKNNIYKTFC